MLSKCANPRCTTPFRYLHEGKLFRVEIPTALGNSKTPAENGRKPPKRTELFWLCDPCSALMTVTYMKDVGVTTLPLPTHSAGAGL